MAGVPLCLPLILISSHVLAGICRDLADWTASVLAAVNQHDILRIKSASELQRHTVLWHIALLWLLNTLCLRGLLFKVVGPACCKVLCPACLSCEGFLVGMQNVGGMVLRLMGMQSSAPPTTHSVGFYSEGRNLLQCPVQALFALLSSASTFLIESRDGWMYHLVKSGRC